MPYGKEVFERASRENKLLLFSIGYSACHWCHVMEHESFENAEVAEVMNSGFINVKIDREERSDVDMYYMQAVQLMTGHGGWPLNCFALPDGRPVYGGTYFNRQQWLNVLNSLSDLYKQQPEKLHEYADRLAEGIQQAELINTKTSTENELVPSIVRAAIHNWKQRLDTVHGGPDKAPKFPLPNNYVFLLRYSLLENDVELMDHVHLTLRKMACGGIYDQIHGGFARYSTDTLWKVPHFEKMLYDNAQLVSLYCEAYRHQANDLYSSVIRDTLEFIEKEWQSQEGGVYSALDADSEGEEGKYYVWTKEELQGVLEQDFDLFADCYHIDEYGYWEHGNYILMKKEDVSAVLVKHNITQLELKERLLKCRKVLQHVAAKRVKPGLDDKILTSWNAMMCSAYADAYLTLGEPKYRDRAVQIISFLTEKLMLQNKLFRTWKNGHAKIDGFLEDYAFLVEALIKIYQITQDESHLNKARLLTEQILIDFENSSSCFLYYNRPSEFNSLTRNTEISDNVIPSSNSQMANNLFYLGVMFGNQEWIKRSELMLRSVIQELRHYGSGYSNWGCLALQFCYPLKELVVVGNNVDEKLRELYIHSFTNAILAVSKQGSDLDLLKGRYVPERTMIYVCENKACKLPVESAREALKQF